MIALDECMLAALALAPQRSDDPVLRELAADVAEDHRAELARLTAITSGR